MMNHLSFASDIRTSCQILLECIDNGRLSQVKDPWIKILHQLVNMYLIYIYMQACHVFRLQVLWMDKILHQSVIPHQVVA